MDEPNFRAREQGGHAPLVAVEIVKERRGVRQNTWR
jgi:hypothetical protein